MSAVASDWRRFDWPAHEHLNGGIRYVDLPGPPGPPIVLIHGMGGHWQHWLANLTGLARTRRVVALDLPGCGGSLAPPPRPAVAQYALAVRALCARLAIKRCTIVGHSFGGCVGLSVATDVDLVNGLVLAAAPGIAVGALQRWLASVAITGLAVTADRLGPGYVPMFSRRRLRWLLLSQAAHRPERLDAELVYRSLLNAPTHSLREVAHAALEYGGADFTAAARGVRCPVMLLWGESDRMVPVSQTPVIRRLLEDSELVTFPRTGHLLMLERPDLFIQHVATFVEQRCSG